MNQLRRHSTATAALCGAVLVAGAATAAAAPAPVAERSHRSATTTAKTFEALSASLRVQSTEKVEFVGDRVDAQIADADDGEEVTLYLSGRKIASGTADAKGDLSLSGVIPSSFGEMVNRTLIARGSTGHEGSTRVSTIKPKTLDTTVWKSSVAWGERQRVRVTNLVPDEPVSIYFGGQRINPVDGKANQYGDLTYFFEPSLYSLHAGTKTVTVWGKNSSRSGAATFTKGAFPY